MVGTNNKPSSNNHSPTTAPSSAPSPDTNNPNFTPKTLHSPWAQVVRGGDTESPTSVHQTLPSSSSSSSSSSLTTATADQAPSCDDSPKAASIPAPVDDSNTVASVVDNSDGSNGNAGRSKKPAWNKPSNIVVVDTAPVMGAESWPALSESTKISAKFPAESSSKVAAAAAAADGSPSTSQGPKISRSPQKQVTSNARSSTASATNNNMTNRPRPARRVGGSNILPGHAQSSSSNPPTPPPAPPFPVYQLPPVGYRNMGPIIPDSSPRDHHRNSNWDARPLVGGSSRRGNFGSHSRGDGSYHHNNYNSRRDHDRGNFVNARDAHVPQPRMPPPRGILRHPPPGTAAFLAPQPIGPFPNPVPYPAVTYDPFRGMPVFPHSPSPVTFFPAAVESPLPILIVNQIDYYFSDANLAKDEYLKSYMDEEGWVPITVIANFPRVKNLTSNVQLILESMRNSTVVDVQGDKLRKHDDWVDYLPSAQVQADSGSVSPSESRYNNITADFQTITLEKTTEDEGESSRQSQLSNGGDVAKNPK